MVCVGDKEEVMPELFNHHFLGPDNIELNPESFLSNFRGSVHSSGTSAEVPMLKASPMKAKVWVSFLAQR